MKIFWILTGLMIFAQLFADNADQKVNPDKVGSLIEPDPVRFSFDTAGCYFIGIMLLLVAIILFYKWLHNYRKNAYRREALKELAAIKDKISENSSNAGLNQLFILLKLVAIQTYGRSEVASLYGKEWISFLEEKGKETPFSNYASEFNNTLYVGTGMDNSKLQQLITLSKKWIVTHA